MKRFFFLALTALAVLVSAQAATVDLSQKTSESPTITLHDGDILTGTLAYSYFPVINIAEGAKVRFETVKIEYSGVVAKFPQAPAIRCLGNAEITISGKNSISSYHSYAGIFVPQGSMLKINGTDADELFVKGGPKAAGIGAYNDVDAGNIQINGGNIEARGGMYGAGIGGGYLANCGTIDIFGGKVKAYGGDRAAGIGSGFDSSKAAYVNITKPAGGATTTVYAAGGYRGAGIGCGCMGTCGVVNISAGTDVTSVKGTESLRNIGWGYGCNANSCGTITIGGQAYADGVSRSFFNYPDIHSINLAMLNEDYTAQDGDMLFGTLANKNVMIQIAANAKITLRNAEIRVKAQDRNAFPGLSCLGNAEITLEGENLVRCESTHKAAIYVPSGSNLEIKGSGKLQAFGGNYAAGIGANDNGYGDFSGRYSYGGTIIIRSGIVEACGGTYGAGIGGANQSHCGIVEIYGGKVTAIGGKYAAGIGTGYDGSEVKGMINIQGGTVDAVGGYYAAGIGCGCMGKCGNITIGSNVTSVRATKGTSSPCSVGKGYGNIGCGTIKIGGTTYPDGIDLSPYVFPNNKVINLATVTGDFTAQDGETLTGKLTNNIKIEIADGAEVILDGVEINAGDQGASAPARVQQGEAAAENRAGISLKGNAELKIQGQCIVKAKGSDYPGIFVPQGKNLVIKGDGELHVYGGSYAAGIGAGKDIDAGNIILQGCNVTAFGGYRGAGVGGAYLANCGEITIYADYLKAVGGDGAPGIGSGYDSSTAGMIYIKKGTINAIGGKQAPGIGAAPMGTCGQIQFFSTISSLKAVKGEQSPYCVGSGYGAASHSGNIFVDGEFYSRGIDRSPYYYPNDKLIDLQDVASDFTAMNGAVLSGKLKKNIKIMIAEGATVTLQDVTIEGVDNAAYKWAGITCNGSASIVLKGDNKVSGFHGDYPAIFVPQNKTLYISGSGSLDAVTHGNAAAIGAAVLKPCGNITILGGYIEASCDGDESLYGAGIGGGYDGGNCGKIKIEGGEVHAYGGNRSAGIGSSYASNPCGDVEITGGKVYAWGGILAPGIGAGSRSVSGNVTIGTGVQYLLAAKGGHENGATAPYCIGISANEGKTTSTIGTIKIGDQIYDGIAGSRFVYPENASDVTELYAPLAEPQESGTAMRKVAKTISLDTVRTDFVFIHGDVITGTLNGNHMLSIMPNAKVTLDNVTITGANQNNYSYAGLTCMGTATIVLKGENTIQGFYESYPGIFVPKGFTLTILKGDGTGTLHASSNGYGAGIGGGYDLACGNIVIESGNIYAEGGKYAAGIGSGAVGAECGSITVAEHGVYLYVVKGDQADHSLGQGVTTSAHGSVSVGGTSYPDGVTESPFIYPSPVSGATLVLDNLQNDYEVTTGMTITGTLKKNVKVSVRGKVTLDNVTINGVNNSNYRWAGLTCAAGTELTLVGTNVIRGFHEDYPGIFMAGDSYSYNRILGSGSLEARSNGNAPGIGASREAQGGRIFFNGCTVKAYGGQGSAGIGGCGNMAMGGMRFDKCVIEAYGGAGAPGIGSGSSGTIGQIALWGDVVSVKAVKGSGNVLSSIGHASSYDNVQVVLASLDEYGRVTPAITLKGITDDTFVYEPVTKITDLLLSGGEVLEGDLSRFHITVSSGATITLDGVRIYGENNPEYRWAGITCRGNNTILVDGLARNEITGFHEDYPGIEVLSGNLYIYDSENNAGGLVVKSNGKAPAIGISTEGYYNGGKITIDLGHSTWYDFGTYLTAYGGMGCPAIGSAPNSTIGDIHIKSGKVNLYGGDYSAAIGASVAEGQCGTITLSDQAQTYCVAGKYSYYSVGTNSISMSVSGETTVMEGIFNGIRLGNEYADKSYEPIHETEFFYPSENGVAIHLCQDGETLSGEVPYRIEVAPGATIYLDNVSIGGDRFEKIYFNPGIKCQGNATIVYRGINNVESFFSYMPGIYVPAGFRLTLRAENRETDELHATCKGDVVQANMVKKVNGRYVVASGNPKMAAGIGGAYGFGEDNLVHAYPCGDIVIESGNLFAIGGAGHPGIGGGTSGDCGNITILGGRVEAIGGTGCPGIGAGSGGSCGTIRMTNQVTRVESHAGENAPYSVGEAEANSSNGVNSVCESIIVGNEDYGTGIIDRIFIYEPTDEERKEDIEIVNGNAQTNDGKTYKTLRNGQLLIIRGNQVFTITGQRVK